MTTKPMKSYEKSRKIHFIKLIILSVAVAFWLTLIFGFSSDLGEDSSKKSGELLVRITNIVAPSLDATIDNYQEIPELENCEKILRKCAHMIEYGILALLLWLLIRELCFFLQKRGSQTTLLTYIISEVIVIVVGTIDEINQTRFVGRFGSPKDVIVDAIGGAVVLAFCHFFFRRAVGRFLGPYCKL